MRLSRLTLLLVLLLVVENLWLAYPTLRGLVLQYQEEPAARGRVLAARLGCFSCHGPDGAGGVPNPGSRWQEVPGFGEQTLMMYAASDDEIRQYILDGAPDARRDDESYREQMAAQAIQMPAYRGVVSDAELEDLVAYVRAVSGLFTPTDEAAKRGATLFLEKGCFHCHGDMGVGGRPNPGSLKGYIPGFVGHDFADLVRDDAELRQWIEKGRIARLEQNAVAAYFIERQRLQMPAYGPFLSAEEIGDLMAYVRWLSREPWRGQPLPH